MKRFEIIEQRGSSQLSTMAHALRMALNSKVNYTYYFVARFDRDLQHERRTISTSPTCLFDELPRDKRSVTGTKDIYINFDDFQAIPGRYAHDFLDFLEQGPGENAENKCCCI